MRYERTKSRFSAVVLSPSNSSLIGPLPPQGGRCRGQGGGSPLAGGDGGRGARKSCRHSIRVLPMEMVVGPWSSISLVCPPLLLEKGRRGAAGMCLRMRRGIIETIICRWGAHTGIGRVALGWEGGPVGVGGAR